MSPGPTTRERRLGDMFADWTNADLDYLAAHLELPGGPADLAEAIRMEVARRSLRPTSVSPDGTDPADRRLRETLYLVLTDSRRFASVRDLVAAVNAAFGCRLNGTYFVRHGRQCVSTHVWAHLRRMPAEQRTKLVCRFLGEVGRRAASAGPMLAAESPAADAAAVANLAEPG